MIENDLNPAAASFLAGYRSWLDYVSEPLSNEGEHYIAGYNAAIDHCDNVDEPIDDDALDAAHRYEGFLRGEGGQ